jgi:hypothetical protein
MNSSAGLSYVLRVLWPSAPSCGALGGIGLNTITAIEFGPTGGVFFGTETSMQLGVRWSG